MQTIGFGTQKPSDDDKIVGKRGMRRVVYATYRPIGITCPSSCAFVKVGCYAKGGNSALHARAAATRSFDPLAWALALPYGSAIRWNVTGDVVGADGAVYREAIRAAHARRPDLAGWTYTHAWADPDVEKWALSLPDNMVCSASTDSESDALTALCRGWRTVASVEYPGDNTGKWHRESAAAAKAKWQYVADSYNLPCVPCPASNVDIPATGCADCLLCMKPCMVLFPAHGAQRTKVRDILKIYRGE